jgi:hypothetical protein
MASKTTYKDLNAWKEYLRTTWYIDYIRETKPQINRSLYLNLDDGTITPLSDVIDLDDEEVDSLSSFTDDTEDDFSNTIREKLAAKDLTISGSRFVIGSKDKVERLNRYIVAQKNIDGLAPPKVDTKSASKVDTKSASKVDTKSASKVDTKSASKVDTKSASKSVTKKQSKSKGNHVTVTAVQEEKETEAQEEEKRTIDEIYDNNVDSIVATMLSATEEEPVCIDLLTGTITCPSGAIIELKVPKSSVPNIRFTYSKISDYTKKEYAELLGRYVTAYKKEETRLNEEKPVKVPSSRSALSKPEKKKKKSEKKVEEDVEALTEKTSALKISKLPTKTVTNTPQPTYALASRKQGANEVPLRSKIAAPPKVTSPEVERAQSRVPVEIKTSATILSLKEAMSRIKLHKGSLAGRAVPAKATLINDVEGEDLIPNGEEPKKQALPSKVTLPAPVNRKGASLPPSKVKPAPSKKKAAAKQATKVVEEESEASNDESVSGEEVESDDE